jgi:hypothetical protein
MPKVNGLDLLRSAGKYLVAFGPSRDCNGGRKSQREYGYHHNPSTPISNYIEDDTGNHKHGRCHKSDEKLYHSLSAYSRVVVELRI